jgi:hypothetical protein
MARKAPDKRVAELRDQIAALKNQRREVSAAPAANAEVKAALDDFIKRRAAEYRVSRITDPLASRARIGSLGVENIEAFAAFFFGDAIRDALLAQVDTGPGLSREDQAARLAKIDDELFAAECAEEQTIVDAEDEGRTIERRGDADPRAVLNSTEGDDR